MDAGLHIPVAEGTAPVPGGQAMHPDTEPPAAVSRGWHQATIIVLIGFPIVYGGVSQLLGQDVDWDLRNYHYFDSYWLLVNHMRDVMPAQLQTYYSPFLDLPFYVAVNHLAPRLIDFLLAVVQGTSFPILYLIARQFTSRRLLGLGLAGLGMFTADALSELGTIMGDTLIAPLLLGAILIGLRAVDAAAAPSSGRPIRRFLLAGGLAGMATGLKPSGLPIALGIVVASAIIGDTFRARLVHLSAAGSGLIAGIAVSYGWWAYELWSRYGNPVLPYMNQFFHSAYAPASPNTLAIPRGIMTILFDPVLWTLDPYRANETNFVELSLLFLEILLVVLVALSAIKAVQRRERLRLFDTERQRYLIVTVLIGYLAWVIEFGIYRYLAPIEMLSFIAIFVCLQALKPRILINEFVGVARQLMIGALIVIVVLCVATEVPGNFGRSAWTGRTFTASLPTAMRKQPSAFLMLGLQPYGYIVPSFPRADFFARIQGNLPPTALVQHQIEHRAASYRHVYVVWSGGLPRHASALQVLEGDTLAAKSYGYAIDLTRCGTFLTSVGAVRYRIHFCRLLRRPRTASARPVG